MHLDDHTGARGFLDLGHLDRIWSLQPSHPYRAHADQPTGGGADGRQQTQKPPISLKFGGFDVCSPRLFELGRRQAQQSACDHQLLDLLGALEDVQDLGVAGPLLQQ
ncbi:Uncharacterised protein [Mycobacterium tuberculosis]|nr:Uncharacterised protein [Mycobacterium tuberculosis]